MDPLAAGSSSTRIPWTIANKYYTADVHFEAHAFEHFRVHHAVGAPAIIYVWGPGEVSVSRSRFIHQKFTASFVGFRMSDSCGYRRTVG